MELGAASQRLIPTGERSGLLTRIAATEGVWSSTRNEMPMVLDFELTIRTRADFH